jgi:phage terminase small subunit
MSEKNALATLTKKHRLFVEAYTGDTINAMLAAGFEGVPAYLKEKGEELLANPIIQEAIKERSRYMAKTFKNIADREERQVLLTSWMRNEDPYRLEEKDANGAPVPRGNLPDSMRLKALELLGKSEGDFVDRIEHSGNLSFSELVTKSYEVEEDIEAIEAEYRQVKEAQAKKLEAPKEDAKPSVLGSFM